MTEKTLRCSIPNSEFVASAEREVSKSLTNLNVYFSIEPKKAKNTMCNAMNFEFLAIFFD